MKIDRLKVAGFKSFADPVEISIGSGITGIVGPNGCGKSNFIEALRWAMGETSAKRMRADGMDDVIFGGTDVRPPRSSCEVTVTIDNSERLAPSEFNSEDRLEVSRRLDRGEGSSYKVNGKQARARDVQVLYKDAGIGSGSSALVSQGKVGAIINAKPSERRTVLEEAAGVTGLASRRHEAELRLRGTEQNLERAEDLERGLSDQVSSLRRQARQARRRHEIDGLVRKAEATAFLVRWRGASDKVKGTEGSFARNEEAVKAAMIAMREAETALAAHEAEAAPAVAGRVEAETALALAKARVESVRKEAAAARSALAASRKALDRLRADLDREKAAIGSSGEEYEELEDRKALAEDDREYDAVLVEEAAAAMQEAREAMDASVAKAQSQAEALAGVRAERGAAERRVAEASGRRAAAAARLDAVTKRLAESSARLAALPPAGEETAAAGEEAARAEAAVDEAEGALRSALEAEAAAMAKDGAAQAALSAAMAELKALESARAAGGAGGLPVVADEGFERAAAAAFGDGLRAALSDDGSDRWWDEAASRLEPPAGARPLSEAVRVPSRMEAALSGIGYAPTQEQAEAAAKGLLPGQAVVTPDGTLRRWDGFRSRGDAVAAEEMRRATRTRQLEAARPGLEGEAGQSALALSSASQAAMAARHGQEAAKRRLGEARAALGAARSKAEGVERDRTALEAALHSDRDAGEAIRVSLEEEGVALAEATEALGSIADPGLAEAELARSRSEAAAATGAYEKRRDALDKAKRDAEARILLIQNVVQQMQDFDRRIVAAREHVAELEERLAEGVAEAEGLAEAESLAPESEALAADAVEEAAAVHAAAVARAAESEGRLSSSREAVRSADASLARMREDRARLLAELKAAQDAAAELAREVGERLSCKPEELGAASGLGDDGETPDLAACEARVQRLARERDGIGVVNLLAEEQLAEAEAKLGEAGKSREELREAVRRLRSTIQDFDREARERLTEAYAQIDGHFRDLFSRLFGGGHAYLRLSGSEDILDAGLEIYACPPGKKLQAMSLLSGGEQALAALALVFAAFLIRPAPVCVLDEVDAPLDDANVDRLCSLVSDMSKESTRFLVVTHHALTMARCDRLYGVTMAERGVSRVAVVDMESAAAMVEAAAR